MGTVAILAIIALALAGKKKVTAASPPSPTSTAVLPLAAGGGNPATNNITANSPPWAFGQNVVFTQNGRPAFSQQFIQLLEQLENNPALAASLGLSVAHGEAASAVIAAATSGELPTSSGSAGLTAALSLPTASFSGTTLPAAPFVPTDVAFSGGAPAPATEANPAPATSAAPG